MLVIVAGTLGYVSTDNHFLADGLGAYFWVLVWWGLLVFQLTCGTPREDAERTPGTAERTPSTASSSISGARPEGGAGGRCWWALLVVGNLNSEIWRAVLGTASTSSPTSASSQRGARCSTPTPSRCCRRC
mmetsp:Transcript_14512/g.46587  ORF Transcript_14512/g.46587 Transcript_14512/m.46587 type:complete len:131 (-) Transcript_14512:652-1044(-)